MPYSEYQAALAIAELRSENARLRSELQAAQERGERLAEENRRLQERMEELEREAARQAAPFRRRERKKVPAEQQKRPGRRAGHVGSCRAVPDHVDQEIEVPLLGCPHCGGEVDDRAPLTQYIEELPPIRPHVTRLVTWSGQCPRCGEVRSTHPTSTGQGAARVQLGPRALGLAATLNKPLGLTMRKTCQVLKRLGGLRITPGGLSQALARVADRVAADYGRLTETIRQSPAVFADETSWWVGGPGWWLWVFTSHQGSTLYRVEESRASQVVHSVLGTDFAGILVSDCLSSYDPPECRKHKCIAHHLKKIKQARERPDTKDTSYLDAWKQLFGQVIDLYQQREQLAPEVFAQQRAQLDEWVDRLLQHASDQPGDVAVRNRLLKQRAHLLGCLDDTAAEPTNNRAERALRPAVIARKLSCGNKTEAGRWCWQILVSLATTCENLGQDFTDFLTRRLPLAVHAG